MKFLRSAGRPGLYVSLALAGLLFINCSKDDDGPTEYDFEDQFEELEELETVEDEDPEITEPDTGGLEQSEATTAIIADLGDGSGDVSAETQASLDAVDTFSNDFSEDVEAEATALDATRVEEILNMSEFDGALAEVEASLEDAPAEILELLPVIDFGSAVEATSSVQGSAFKGSEFDLDLKNVVSQANGSGPCFEAAQDAYDEAMAPAIAKRQENLDVIEANYQRRVGEAETRAADRQEVVNASYETFYDAILDATVNLLNYADAIEDTAPSQATVIRKSALNYIVQATKNLNAWYVSASQLVDQFEAAEKERAEELKEQRTAQVEANFAEIKAEADAILQAAYADCHNQGGAS